MSLLSGLISGGSAGFASGGIWGGVIGAVGGALAGAGKGNKNPNKTKNVGVQPQFNVTKGKVQLNPALSPTPMPGINTPQSALTGMAPWNPSIPMSSGAMSASGLVRGAMYGGSPPNATLAQFLGGGASGSYAQLPTTPYGGITSMAPGYSPMAMYHRFYTKKGTLRRVTRNGVPYKPPHMNPMNPRAARRAIRRIRGARKLLQRIERSLPKARTHRAPPRRHAA